MGTFDGLQTSLSALYAQRRGLDVTGQNIANANTVGYSRQRVEMQSISGTTVPALYATGNPSVGGVRVADVTRMRDAFMDIRGRAAHASLAQTEVSQQALSQVETVMSEPSDTGLASSLNAMWAGFHELALHPDDEGVRSLLLQRAAGVADWLHSAHAALSDQWSASRTQLDALTTEANGAASGIAELNGAIKRATLVGLPSNELADQRDQLVMKLAELTGATTSAAADGTLDVDLDGKALVRGAVATTLTTTGPTNPATVSSPAAVGLALGGVALGGGLGGTSAGYLDVLNSTIPGYAAGLDAVAVSVKTAVNGQQVQGRDLDGTLGVDFFAGTGAADLSVAITDPRLVAAAAESPFGPTDGTNADKLAKLADLVNGPDAGFRKLVVDLGVAAQTVNRRVDVQAAVATDIDDARDSAAGVNIDEEMVNMLTFQHAYEAASRMLTSVDEMLDTLINHTGLVGR
jgi:flagellar hook-associated protein 1